MSGIKVSALIRLNYVLWPNRLIGPDVMLRLLRRPVGNTDAALGSIPVALQEMATHDRYHAWAWAVLKIV